MKTKTKVIIGVIIALVGMTIMVSGLFNKKAYPEVIEIENTSETITTGTTIPKTEKTTKKAVKTTKKKVSKFNIKASRQEIVDYAYQQVVNRWGKEHWDAFYQLVSHESGWNPNSVNKKTGACGLFQFVPCNKGGSKYKTDYRVQVQKGMDYISARYGTPNKAWAFWQKHHWY